MRRFSRSENKLFSMPYFPRILYAAVTTRSKPPSAFMAISSSTESGNSLIISRCFLYTGQPRNLNGDSLFFCKLQLAGQRVLINFMERHFPKILHDKKIEPSRQCGRHFMFFGSQRQASSPVFQPFHFNGQKIFSSSNLKPEIIAATKACRVLH